jgi:peptidyl-tRNA hydrolase
VILHLGTEDIPRLKVGIGDAGQRRITRHVLDGLGKKSCLLWKKFCLVQRIRRSAGLRMGYRKR